MMTLQLQSFLNKKKETPADTLGLADIKYASELSKDFVEPTSSFAFFVEKLAEQNTSSSNPLAQIIADLNHRWRDDPDSVKAWEELADGLGKYNLLNNEFRTYIEEQIQRIQEQGSKQKFTGA